jgi:hypothetical protein
MRLQVDTPHVQFSAALNAESYSTSHFRICENGKECQGEASISMIIGATKKHHSSMGNNTNIIPLAQPNPSFEIGATINHCFYLCIRSLLSTYV